MVSFKFFDGNRLQAKTAFFVNFQLENNVKFKVKLIEPLSFFSKL